MKKVAAALVVAVLTLFVSLFTIQSADDVALEFGGDSSQWWRSPIMGLCEELIRPSGYPCSEHIINTEDGYRLALQRIGSPTEGLQLQRGPPVLLQHGLFMAGDAWFLNSAQQSLGFILADHGFDVWVCNVRGTRWSYGHISFSQRDKEFWNWSWQELALYDLGESIRYVHSMANSKVFFVGHSQGTLMGLAAFTQPHIVNMVEAAALLCPISYLDHTSAPFVLQMVAMHMDEMILDVGIHKLDFRSEVCVKVFDAVCNTNVDCTDFLTSFTGMNCFMNASRVEFYLQYEPHPSSSKNLNHLFQMIRKGTFSYYDYGAWRNLKRYGILRPPDFELASIPKSLPLWMGYGGNDELGDWSDLEHTLRQLQSHPKLLYLSDYGHLDFLLSVSAKEDAYDDMIEFFRSFLPSNAAAVS